MCTASLHVHTGVVGLLAGVWVCTASMLWGGVVSVVMCATSLLYLVRWLPVGGMCTASLLVHMVVVGVLPVGGVCTTSLHVPTVVVVLLPRGGVCTASLHVHTGGVWLLPGGGVCTASLHVHTGVVL